jgi:uncharacterized protein (TIGR04255 family)
LPDYERPPIDEVIIGLQYQPIGAFSQQQINDLWQRVVQDYPSMQPQALRFEAPLEPLVSPPPINIQTGPPPLSVTPNETRVWLVGREDDRLIQVQNGSFICNWRRRNNPYPHFETLHEEFWRSYEIFLQVLADSHLETPTPLQTEVTYINWFQNETLTGETFLPFSSTPENLLSGSQVLEDAGWISRYFVTEDGQAVGRLHVQCSPAIRLSPPAPGTGTQLQITLRTPTRGVGDRAGLERLFAIGRRRVVLSFHELTTVDAHQRWGYIQ